MILIKSAFFKIKKEQGIVQRGDDESDDNERRQEIEDKRIVKSTKRTNKKNRDIMIETT